VWNINRRNRISGMFGGTRNWRGPIWDAGECAHYPRAIELLCLLTGTISGSNCTTGSGKLNTLYGLPKDITGTIGKHLSRDNEGQRPCSAERKIQGRPVLEGLSPVLTSIFHGDNGAGLGASHQTGLDRYGCKPHATCLLRHKERRARRVVDVRYMKEKKSGRRCCS